MSTLAVISAVSLTLVACAPIAPDGDGALIVDIAVDGSVAQALTAEIQSIARAAGVTVEVRTVDALPAPSEPGENPQLEADIVLTSDVMALMQLSDAGGLTPVSTLPGIVPEELFAEVGAQWMPITANAEEETVAFPVAVSLSSVTFVNPLAFAEHGYVIPTSSDEFDALVATIEKDNAGYPWCAGMENGALSGDPFIDWLAEYVLFTAGEDTYRSWLSGDVTSDSSEIASAANAARDALAAHSVAKGNSAVLLTDGFANTVPMFDLVGTYGKQCFFLRQSPDVHSFLTDVVKAEVAASSFRQISAFPFFGAGKSDSAAPIVDAIFAGVGRVDKDVVAFITAFGTTPFGDGFGDTTNWVSARISTNADSRTNPFAAVNSAVLSSTDTVVLSPRSVMTSERLSALRAASVLFLSGEAEWAAAAASAD
jgi:alpha-glucoside transport system substrate-binding protein